MSDTCVKLCLLLEMLISVKYMNILHYYCDTACPRTTMCKDFTLVTVVTLFMLYLFIEKWRYIDEIERDLAAR